MAILNKQIKEITFKIKTYKKREINFLDIVAFGKKYPNHSLQFYDKEEKFITLEHHFETKTNINQALEDIKNQLKAYEKAYDVEIINNNLHINSNQQQ